MRIALASGMLAGARLLQTTAELTRLVTAALLALAVGILARALGALTWGGALAAGAVGGVTYGIGGLQPALLLLTFFGSSSLLSRLGAARKRTLAAAYQKSGARDHGQVLANGALAAALAAGFGWSGEVGWLVGAAGALAASNADTWSTELGVLSRTPPRLITSGMAVPAGSSGAISALGSAAALGGAALIGAAAAVLTGEARLLLPITLGGTAAAAIDSLLGASVQAVYFCPACGQETEAHPRHSCGWRTEFQRGWRWLGNDQINLLAGGFGALVSVGLWAIRV